MYNIKSPFSMLSAAIMLIGSSVTISSAFASSDDACQDHQTNYQVCDNQLGWYLGGELGYAKTDISRHNINDFVNGSGISSQNVSLDKSDMMSKFFLGYQFNSYFSLEGGFLNLGEREISYQGSSADLDAYFDNVSHILPQSGEGLTVNAVMSWPISESVKVSAKLGYFDWKGDYVSSDPLKSRKSGGDWVYGAELNYRLADQYQLYFSLQQTTLDDATNNSIGLGLRYYFNEVKKPRKIKKTVAVKSVKAAPTPRPAPVAVKKLLDTDHDGVLDSKDKCPSTDSTHTVDQDGCTITKAQSYQFSLVVYFDNNSDEVGASYYDKVAELADFIEKYEVKTLTIYGHTSAVGNATYNQKLSERRSQAVADLLVSEFNVEAKVLNPVGKGESMLLDEGNTSQAHKTNRRIELSIEETLILPVLK